MVRVAKRIPTPNHIVVVVLSKKVKNMLKKSGLSKLGLVLSSFKENNNDHKKTIMTIGFFLPENNSE